MTELFKTNIRHHYDAIRLKELLLKEFPSATFQFDLQHKDHLLRVEAKNIPVAGVVQLIKHQGFYCEIVEKKIES